MNKAQEARCRKALARLVVKVGDALAIGQAPTLGQRMEYNALKRKLNESGTLI